MCSRFSLTAPADAVRALFRCQPVEAYPPRYNIAPTEPILVIHTGHKGERQPTLMRWGLLPSWVKEPKAFATLINARAETVREKPSFRAAVRHRRCLIPADGFYEWTGVAGHKQPHRIRLSDAGGHGSLFGFAGLYETWLGADGSEIDTATILTTAANDDMTALHDRMPLILDDAQFDRWLDCSSGSSADIADLLEPRPAGRLIASPVSRRLNNPRNEGPELWHAEAQD